MNEITIRKTTVDLVVAALMQDTKVQAFDALNTDFMATHAKMVQAAEEEAKKKAEVEDRIKEENERLEKVVDEGGNLIGWVLHSGTGKMGGKIMRWRKSQIRSFRYYNA